MFPVAILYGRDWKKVEGIKRGGLKKKSKAAGEGRGGEERESQDANNLLGYFVALFFSFLNKRISSRVTSSEKVSGILSYYNMHDERQAPLPPWPMRKMGQFYLASTGLFTLCGNPLEKSHRE